MPELGRFVQRVIKRGCHAFACESMCHCYSTIMVPFRRKRCKRYDIPGHAHYLTFSCFQRRPFLAVDPPRRWLLETLVAARSRIAFDLWAYVIMPEHVHLLVWPREKTPVSEILRQIKLPVAKRVLLWAQRENPEILKELAATNLHDGCHAFAQRKHASLRKHANSPNQTAYHFWQRGGGYDRNLWSPQEIREKINYIHANPVRRRLAARPQDWSWSSWSAWEGTDAVSVPIDKHSVPPLET